MGMRDARIHSEYEKEISRYSMRLWGIDCRYILYSVCMFRLQDASGLTYKESRVVMAPFLEPMNELARTWDVTPASISKIRSRARMKISLSGHIEDELFGACRLKPISKKGIEPRYRQRNFIDDLQLLDSSINDYLGIDTTSPTCSEDLENLSQRSMRLWGIDADYITYCITMLRFQKYFNMSFRESQVYMMRDHPAHQVAKVLNVSEKSIHGTMRRARVKEFSSGFIEKDILMNCIPTAHHLNSLDPKWKRLEQRAINATLPPLNSKKRTWMMHNE